MELIKDYYCRINYHPGKANVVTIALSKKSIVDLAPLRNFQLIMEFDKLRMEVVEKGWPGLLDILVLQPELLERIKAGQVDDLECQKIKQQIKEAKGPDFYLLDDRLLTHHKQIYVLGCGWISK